MSFTPANDDKFRKGDDLLASDLNEKILARLERLEKVFSGNLSCLNSADGISFNLLNSIPDIEFIENTQEITADPTILFTGEILDQDTDPESPTYLDFFSTGEEIEFRNIFQCTLTNNKRCLVIRFPRGNGEYIWIPKACN